LVREIISDHPYNQHERRRHHHNHNHFSYTALISKHETPHDTITACLTVSNIPSAPCCQTLFLVLPVERKIKFTDLQLPEQKER
jgi:hypothetical protein